MKTAKVWTLTQPTPGHFHWTTRHNRQHTINPEPTDPALPPLSPAI
jgi:hypothetical protein